MIKKLHSRLIAFALLANFSASLLGQTCIPTCVAPFSSCLPVTADYVIVGNGTAGAVVASYLSDPVGSVIVLEAGENLATDPLVTAGGPFNGNSPVGYLPLYTKTYAANYGPNPIGPSPYSGLFNPTGLYAGTSASFIGMGRMWGGSSSHYYFITVRGAPSYWNSLATAVGSEQWSYDNLLPYFKGMENYSADGTFVPNPTQRGTGGQLNISTQPLVPQGSQFLNTFSAVSQTPYANDYNIDIELAISAQQIWSSAPSNEGTRTSSITGFLPDTVVSYTSGTGLNGRPLQIISQAYATRILFSTPSPGGQPTAIGVEYILENSDEVLHVYANKGVIISAGALETPKLLQLSGIGDPALLTPLNIPVVLDQPLVGQGLKNQYGPCATMFIEGNDEIFEPVGTTILAFVDLSSPDNPAEYIQTPFEQGTRRNEMLVQRGPFQFPVPELLQVLPTPPAFADAVSVITTILEPMSTGSVFIVSNDPLIDPQINFNFFSDGLVTNTASDLSQAVAALSVLGNIAKQYAIETLNTVTMYYPPMEYYPEPVGPQPNADKLVEAAQNVYVVMNHPVGTCQMGASQETAVVNSETLAVYGVNNLYIADNSIYPTPESGNTGYQAYIAGIKLAQLLGATVRTQ